ncbi:MAG TPA: DUF4340 domain-containing protein [Rhizomicrobium sp.]|jgi:hypothetical protein
MNLNTLLQDPRRRNLAILAAVAAVLVLLAILAVRVEQREVAPRDTTQSFFPNLEERVRKGEVARIHVQTRKGAFDIAFKPYRGWVIPQRNDYPASVDLVRQTIVGFAVLTTIEPKTARPDWLGYVNLDAPPKGHGALMTLMDEHGNAIASMIVGKSVDIGDPDGSVGIFVRKPDSDQSWLVKSPVEFKSDPSDWIEKSVMTVDRARIAETDVDPVGAASYEARRESARDPDFAVTDVPAGRELADPTAADGIAAAISNFAFVDARPAKDFDFGDAARFITKTFDGLTVTVETLKRDDGYWATVSAEAAAGRPDAAREAREINAHANGWAYKLPDAEGQLFMTPLDSLLKPIAAKTP